MIKDFRKTKNFKKIKNGQFSFFYILQLPHSVISNSEKLTHPTVQHLLDTVIEERNMSTNASLMQGV